MCAVAGMFITLASCDLPHRSAAAGAKKSDKAALAAVKKIETGNNVFLEILPGGERRVRVQAYVCLRQGQLEQFLTRRGGKEHEAVLAAAIDARDVHTALTLAKAEAGHPVRFQPSYQPASGTPIKIVLEYTDQGKTISVPAQNWVRNVKTKKTLATDWVFAGSVLLPDPFDAKKKPLYAANDGDVICISNFDTALLDLPINSSKDADDLQFEAYTERIPPLGTPVQVILEPVLKKK